MKHYLPDANKLFEMYNKYAGKYWGGGNKFIADLSFGYFDEQTLVKADLKDVIKIPFENIEVVAKKTMKTYCINYMVII